MDHSASVLDTHECVLDTRCVCWTHSQSVFDTPPAAPRASPRTHLAPDSDQYDKTMPKVNEAGAKMSTLGFLVNSGGCWTHLRRLLGRLHGRIPLRTPTPGTGKRRAHTLMCAGHTRRGRDRGNCRGRMKHYCSWQWLQFMTIGLFPVQETKKSIPVQEKINSCATNFGSIPNV